ncbi:unnamed protein product [Pieris brassicae]|uniref:Small ribosomal subunit protein uS13 n=1 Tax=Pieris brassicae TaxID=7116 RepID=A0A9P0X6Q4_PIEBR|nr:unnamed protein product [Pieris brassicae]
MSLVIPDKFQHILRIMNTNIDGKRKVMFAMTAIKGVGRRYSNIVLKKADIDLDKRAGECTEEEVEKIITIMSNPRQYKIPDWFLNRQKDIVDGVCVTIGACVSVVNTQRPLADVVELWVYLRRSKLNKHF